MNDVAKSPTDTTWIRLAEKKAVLTIIWTESRQRLSACAGSLGVRPKPSLSDEDFPRFGWHVGRRGRKAWSEDVFGRIAGKKITSERTTLVGSEVSSTQGADGHQIIVISLSGFLLASSLATEHSMLETVLLTEGKTSPLFRDQGVANRRLWRLGAKVLGNLVNSETRVSFAYLPHTALRTCIASLLLMSALNG